jgi:hypothetical protein
LPKIKNLQLCKKASPNLKDIFEILMNIGLKKHVSDPLNNSAAKRINMYLRWMVRQDTTGVDLGIWKSISCCLVLP